LPQRSLGLALATGLCGWSGKGPAHGFGLPIYNLEEGARGYVGLAATLLPIPHSIDRKATLFGEFGLRQTQLGTDSLYIDLFGDMCDEPLPRAPRIV